MEILMTNSIYKIKTNDREYVFNIPSNAPKGEAFDVVFKFLSLISADIENTTKSIKKDEVKNVETEVVNKE